MIEYTINTPGRELKVNLQDVERSAIMEVYVEDGVMMYTAIVDKEHVTDWMELDAVTER